MKPAHKEWADKWVAERSGGSVRGACAAATRDMKAAFPDLVIVRGFVRFETGGRAEHVWCTDVDGVIIDPTASQFEGEFTYEPFKPGDVVRVGRCMECGMAIYAAVDSLDNPAHARSFCDDDCRRDFEVAFDAPW